MPAPIVSADAYRAALRVAVGAARSAADRHRDRLAADPNVVDVRPGFKFTDGWITDTPAVVVTVLRKGDPAALGSRPLEPELDGVPVDVAPATPAQQLRHFPPTAVPSVRSWRPSRRSRTSWSRGTCRPWRRQREPPPPAGNTASRRTWPWSPPAGR